MANFGQNRLWPIRLWPLANPTLANFSDLAFWPNFIVVILSCCGCGFGTTLHRVGLRQPHISLFFFLFPPLFRSFCVSLGLLVEFWWGFGEF